MKELFNEIAETIVEIVMYSLLIIALFTILTMVMEMPL